MKRNLEAIGLSLILAGSLLALTPPMTRAAETSERVVIPATLDGLWQAIDAKSAELKKTIDSGALDQVHHEAFAIRDLVAGLPAKSGSLPAESLAKVKSSVKFVATLAERLDATGDAKDAAGTKQNFEKLSSVLASLKGNYPASK
jgi:hypothetical protein